MRARVTCGRVPRRGSLRSASLFVIEQCEPRVLLTARYSLIDLGTLGGPTSSASAVNSAGEVVGTSADASGALLPFIWTPAGMSALGPLPDTPFGQPIGASASDINDAGEVVGALTLLDVPGRWQPFRWTQAAGYRIIDDQTVNAGAAAVNAAGDAVGANNRRAIKWLPTGEVLALPSAGWESSAVAINDAGIAVGSLNYVGGIGGRRWAADGTATDLPTLGGNVNHPSGINNAGTIVGSSNLTVSGHQHAYLYSGGMITDLGTLGGSSSRATALNDAGYVVGESDGPDGARLPFVWNSDTGMQSLKELIDSSGSGWRLEQVTSINSKGQMAGSGVNPAGRSHAFLLTPRTRIVGRAIRPSDGATTPVILRRLDGLAIDPELPSWLVIHGRNGSAGALSRLANIIDGHDSADQVLTLDWSDGAAASGLIDGLDFTGEDWIEPVAEWTATELKEFGFTGSTLNLIGHSWGSYVAAETAQRIAYEPDGLRIGVHTIVALDPAIDADLGNLQLLGGAYDAEGDDNGVAEIDFGRQSDFSWAFRSSPLGSSKTANTADESFDTIVGGDAWLSSPRSQSAHSNIVELFTVMVQANISTPTGPGQPDPVSRRFSLARLLDDPASRTTPWLTNASGFEANLEATREGGTWMPLSMTYETGAGPALESVILAPSGDASEQPNSLGSVDATRQFRYWVGRSNMDDYHQFTLPARTRFSLLVDGLSADANVRFIVGAPPLQRIWTSNRPGASPEALRTTLARGSYVVHIRAASIYENTFYNLILQSVSARGRAATATAGSAGIIPSDTRSAPAARRSWSELPVRTILDPVTALPLLAPSTISNGEVPVDTPRDHSS